ncbi:hypothetical protein [Vibrio parahaemolyticus]|uniref:hypothetical protein n=2 Tax=Vibrio parahaemolyticus TaxID=670 RepID=UPI0004DFA803|nr:hypothetical protein [Vibrio parahaemolyticus]EHU5134608.1 hypothetical protein [Vibrio parahaemolyticus]MBD6989229.1 hypothetical protein [Vibrio parahaemolyticus]
MLKEPYENIYIGNFIYTLGFLSGKKNKSSNEAGVHLIQQTPDDKEWADLLSRWKGSYFLFEFKKQEKGCKSERHKKYCKDQCPGECYEHRSSYYDLINTEKFANYKETADKSHFIGFGVNNGKNRDLEFIPYASVIDSDIQNKTNVKNLTQLCHLITNKDESVGVDGKTFNNYLKFLNACIGGKKSAAGGFIVNIDYKGNVNLVELKHISQLAKNLNSPDKQYPKLTPEQKVELDKKRNKTNTRKYVK